MSDVDVNESTTPNVTCQGSPDMDGHAVVSAEMAPGNRPLSAPAVLFAGGTGTVGRRAVRWFRARHPDIPRIVGGRSLSSASRAARDTELAHGVSVDLARRDLGLSSAADIAAVVMLAPDDALNGVAFAQTRGVPYLNIGNGLVQLRAGTRGPRPARRVLPDRQDQRSGPNRRRQGRRLCVAFAHVARPHPSLAPPATAPRLWSGSISRPAAADCG